MSIELYTCSPCKIYVDSYSAAFNHLKLQHDLKTKSVESVKFPQPSVCVERLKDEVPSLSKSRRRINPETIRGKKNGTKNEIKLEERKASEIEVLVETLYKTSNKEHGGGGRSPRAAAIIAKQALSHSLSDEVEDAPKSPKPKTKLDLDKDRDYQVRDKHEDLLEDDDAVSSFSSSDLYLISDENEKTSTKQHRRTAKGKKETFFCRLCKVEFSHRRAYSKHMKTEHVDKDGTLHCSHCDKTFNNLRFLTRHLKHLEEVKEHPCPKCENSFLCPDYLRRHLKQHGVQRKVSNITKNQEDQEKENPNTTTNLETDEPETSEILGL